MVLQGNADPVYHNPVEAHLLELHFSGIFHMAVGKSHYAAIAVMNAGGKFVAGKFE